MAIKRILKRDRPNYGLALPELFDMLDAAIETLRTQLSSGEPAPRFTASDHVEAIQRRFNRIRQEMAGLIVRTPEPKANQKQCPTLKK